jgi:hypothetical protein
MEYSKIQKSIQDLAIENFNAYKEQYVSSLPDAIEKVKSVADRHFSERTEDEISRDEKNEITLEIYERWMCWSLCSWLNQQPEMEFTNIQDLFSWTSENLEDSCNFERDLQTDNIFHPAFALIHEDDSINFHFEIIKENGFNSTIQFIYCESV